MKLKYPADVSNLAIDDPNFINFVAQMLNAITNVINGDLTFSDNFSAKLVSVVFNTANVSQAVNHGLNRIPVGYLNIGSKAASTVYNGTLPNTRQTIYLQATVATTVNVLVF